MTSKLAVYIALLTLMTSCATQKTDSGESSEKSPAPVREASIVVSQKTEEVRLVTDISTDSSSSLPAEEDTNDSAAENEASADAEVAGQIELSDINTDTPLDAAETEDSTLKIGEGAAAGAGTAILNTIPANSDHQLAGEIQGESDVAAYLLDEAENSFKRANYDKARGQSERALAVEPTAGRAYVILARISVIEGKPDEAAEWARQGLASTTETGEVFEQLNQLLGDVDNMSLEPTRSADTSDSDPIETPPSVETPPINNAEGAAVGTIETMDTQE